MGPYYRDTSQGLGSLFDAVYQYPILTLLIMGTIIAAGYYFYKRYGNS